MFISLTGSIELKGGGRRRREEERRKSCLHSVNEVEVEEDVSFNYHQLFLPPFPLPVKNFVVAR